MAEYADLIGAPYRLNARGPDAYDCYGLIIELHRRRGVQLPDYRARDNAHAAALFMLGLANWRECEPAPGSALLILVAIPGTGESLWHCGMVVDGLHFVHTWARSGGVTRERLSLWRRKIKGFYSFEA